MAHYIQGLLMGLAYVMPIGMQNMFVINAALAYPKRRAFITSLIVTLFDISLGFACFFGVGALMQKSDLLQKMILGVGSIIVIVIGIGLIRAKGHDLQTETKEISIWKTVLSAFVVTWCNPQALIDGTMMLGAFRVSLPAAAGNFFICGVFTASILWFNGLALLITRFSHKMNEKVIRGINLVCGIIITGYGIRLFFEFISRLSA